MDGAAAVERTEPDSWWGDLDRARPGEAGERVEAEEPVPAEAGVALATVGIEDPEGRPPAGRTGAVAGDEDLGRLADDVPPEADPGPPGELEADPRPLSDCGGHRGGQPRRLEDEEADPGPAGEGGEATEAIGEPRRSPRPGRQVHDEEVHGPAGQERARDREPFLRAGRSEDDEPFRADAAGHGLDRVEGAREVQPGDDGTARLGLRGEPKGERGPPAREVAPERQAHPAGQPAGPQDRVQLRKAGREDLGRVRSTGPSTGPSGGIDGGIDLDVQLRRRHREGAHHLPDGAGRGRSPARSKGRQGRRHVRGKCRHQGQVSNICSNESIPNPWPGALYRLRIDGPASSAPWTRRGRHRFAGPAGSRRAPGPRCYTLGPSSRPVRGDVPVGM